MRKGRDRDRNRNSGIETDREQASKKIEMVIFEFMRNAVFFSEMFRIDLVNF